jgi:hypothetical protein
VSKGLGSLQRSIKEALTFLWSKNAQTRFDEIAKYLLYNHDGAADIWFDRSARRALDGLLRRGDVICVGGLGTSRSPREFLNVEDFARLASKKPPRNTAEAKTIAAEIINHPIFASTIPDVVQHARQKAAARSRRARR